LKRIIFTRKINESTCRKAGS